MLESGEDFLYTTHPSQRARHEGNLQLFQSPLTQGSVSHFPSIASIVVTQHTRNLLNMNNGWCLTQLPTLAPIYICTNVEGKCNMANKSMLKPAPAALVGPDGNEVYGSAVCRGMLPWRWEPHAQHCHVTWVVLQKGGGILLGWNSLRIGFAYFPHANTKFNNSAILQWVQVAA